jgi:hypothetical protein
VNLSREALPLSPRSIAIHDQLFRDSVLIRSNNRAKVEVMGLLTRPVLSSCAGPSTRTTTAIRCRWPFVDQVAGGRDERTINGG